ncbi:serine/threonine protein phosphatase [Aliirhizobium terrae]|uniref:metallophosphoesterase family protein n=1 Tax=Terrirhizobium terrae TaxID=2926709 RepID=UPI002575A495|nr:metallophosphoesterase family protein [Rhizobium sp. CC-CFT758]WJH39645.1 serine/threonine protein phosphatase [Rhizobium sp. CC-CFT758]
MRKIIGWMKRSQTVQAAAPSRRRIDLGDEPATYPIYAIGDVHGCLRELQDAEARIAHDVRRTGRPGLVVMLGDYVDRGPSSCQVVEHLLTPSELGLRRLALCGNHDDVFSKFIEEPDLYMDWLGLGGEQTLMSYGIDLRHLTVKRKSRSGDLKELLAEAIPASHREFLSHLPICLKIGNIVFVHAGLRPRLPLADQHDEDLMWIRDPFLTEGSGLPIIVVHGHTPQPEPSLGPGRIGIDTGAYYTGNLTVLKIDGEEKAFI